MKQQEAHRWRKVAKMLAVARISEIPRDVALSDDDWCNIAELADVSRPSDDTLALLRETLDNTWERIKVAL